MEEGTNCSELTAIKNVKLLQLKRLEAQQFLELAREELQHQRETKMIQRRGLHYTPFEVYQYLEEKQEMEVEEVYPEQYYDQLFGKIRQQIVEECSRLHYDRQIARLKEEEYLIQQAIEVEKSVNIYLDLAIGACKSVLQQGVPELPINICNVRQHTAYVPSVNRVMHQEKQSATRPRKPKCLTHSTFMNVNILPTIKMYQEHTTSEGVSREGRYHTQNIENQLITPNIQQRRPITNPKSTIVHLQQTLSQSVNIGSTHTKIVNLDSEATDRVHFQLSRLHQQIELVNIYIGSLKEKLPRHPHLRSDYLSAKAKLQNIIKDFWSKAKAKQKGYGSRERQHFRQKKGENVDEHY